MLSEEKDLGVEIYFVLPRIFRVRSEVYADKIKKYLLHVSGVLVRNMEELQWLQECNYSGVVVTDFTIYRWNRSALDYLKNVSEEYTYPIELSMGEVCDLQERDGCYVVYGRVPMMVSANCTKKTMQNCTKNENRFAISIRDRYNKVLPIYCNCIHCYNEVYNAVPTSNHKDLKRLIKNGFHVFRLDFTNEDKQTVVDIIKYYEQEFSGNKNEMSFPITEYTTGHFKEGAM